MKFKKLLLLLSSVLVLSGCDILVPPSSSSSSQKVASENTDNPEDTTDDITDDDSIYEKDAYKNISLKNPDFSTRKIASKEDVTFDDLFNLGNKVSINVKISDNQLNLLQRDYEIFKEKGWKPEAYRIAETVEISLENNGKTFTWSFDQVGIRQKGNTSRKDVYLNGEMKELNHFKLSFDETFDDAEIYGKDVIDWTNKAAEKTARENREFLGLSGLDVKWNKNYDTSHIKEIYSSYLYDAAGLMTPSIGLTKLSITKSNNNKTYDYGLCTLFEPVSKSFIKRELKKGPYVNMAHWDEEKESSYGVVGAKYGDYYKASWGIGQGSTRQGPNLTSDSTNGKRVGVGNKEGSYVPAYERKTNTDVVYSDTPLRNLTKAITNSSYSEIEKLMDLEYFAISEACNYYIGNPDDLRNNNNNYTIYFRRTDGKAIIIPIDNDRCFGITKDWNPDGKGMTEMSVFTTSRPGTGDEMNKLHTKTILSKTSNDSKAIYLNYVKALKESSWTKNETFKKYYDIAFATYGNESCVTSFGDGFNFDINSTHGNWSFSDYIIKKLNMVDLEQTIDASNKEENNSQGNQDSSITGDGYYGNIYLVGSFMNWEKHNKNYPLEYKGEGVYTVTFTAQNSDNGIIKYKFYDGEEYWNLDWTVVDGKLSMEVGSSAKLNANNGDEVTITINTLTLEVNIEVKNA